MVLPICDVCLKSGILCPGCGKKFKNGEVTQTELDIAKIIFKLGDGKIGFNRAIDRGDAVIIITDKNQVGQIIGKGGKIVRAITKEIGKKVRVVGDGSDLKSVSSDLIAPARISGINIVYGRDGQEKYKIRVMREDARRIPGKPEQLNAIIKLLTGKETIIVLDDQ
ncbi:MAG: KH domain-containing protein [Euryarchaeota archaeon]|nr:KH domain-containing protein [Euryarchaeota archaeon]MBU4607151.1 KH domain-containing protein [Euryarchaeota archaeon]MBV1728750.1 KH domain-containing protein [Methanobacterium sp.]MBV1755488.1 KH domain-containing protein [Methanobacterium sp.]